MRRLRSPALLLFLLLAAGCGGGGAAGGGPTTAEVDPRLPTAGPAAAASAPETTTAPPDATAEADATAEPDPAATEPDPAAEPGAPAPDRPDLRGLSLALEEVARIEAPTAMATRPGDATLYVAERAGRVRPISPDGQVGAPLVDISGATATNNERGLLGIAWSPAGDRLYLSSSDTDGATRLEVIEAADGTLQPDRRVELLRVPQPASNHNGGNILFGPDGMLWLGLGDGGGENDQFGHGQRPDTLLAAMLRIDPQPDGTYAIPSDNPYADGQGGAPEVWAHGLRNPWRFSFDAANGDLWIADVGQHAVEEINRVAAAEAGLDYGWPRFEGDRPFDGRPPDGPTVQPVHTYDHGRGCSITGGYVYRGRAIPSLQGAYLYSDFCSGDIWALDIAADGTVRDDVDTGLDVPQMVSFGEGPDGELYALSLEGPVLRIIQG